MRRQRRIHCTRLQLVLNCGLDYRRVRRIELLQHSQLFNRLGFKRLDRGQLIRSKA
jgi:hypothetical protein